jgi:hypothetical protein
MDEMDRVWDRLKDRAAMHAEAGVLVSMADARRIVSRLCDGECENAPEEVKEHLASELVRLTLEANNARRQMRHFERGVC